MNDKSIAHEIKKEILVKSFNRYFFELEKAGQKSLVDNYWRKAQLLYNSLDESNKENLKAFIQMVMMESISEMLAYIDGDAQFKGQEYPFELLHNGTKVSGSLMEYFLMDIEMNGFE